MTRRVKQIYDNNSVNLFGPSAVVSAGIGQNAGSKMFLYQRIYAKLKEDILQGVYAAENFLPPENSMAEKYGVDRTTVRKAIELLIAEHMVERHVAKGTFVIYGTEQAREKEALNIDSSGEIEKKMIAFLLPKSGYQNDRITVPFYSQLFYETEKRSKHLGFTVVYSTLDETDDIMSVLGQRLENLAGIIFVSNIAEKHIDSALLLKLPVVLINGYSEKIPSITSDDFTGAYKACEHLIECGHRKIGVLNGVSQYASASSRLNGVVRCLQDHDLKLESDFLISNNGWEHEDGYEAMHTFLSGRTEFPTAFICFNDRLASGALEAVYQSGLKVPEDISMVGYDNSDICNYLYPKLSSIENHIPAIAEHAIAALYYQIASGYMSPARILIPVKYVERDSVRLLPIKKHCT